MVLMISALIALAVLALLLLGLRFVENLERENRAVEAQVRAAQMYDGALTARMQKMKRFRHDVNGLLLAVEYASANGDSDDGPGQAEADGESQAKSDSLLDALLSLKRIECAGAGIEFSCDVSETWRGCAQVREIEEGDVRAIVQNLLQNAYEASLQVVPASRRAIVFHLSDQGGKLAIRVSNRTASAEMPSFDTTKDNPEEHGIGLQVIDRIVEFYDGSKQVDFDSQSRMISVQVVL